MEDQVRSLAARGIRATYLASTLSMDERSARKTAIRRGEIDLVYVAPERLQEGVASFLSRGLELLAIDEAHCVVQWGHDFRPDYLRIGEFIRERRPARVLACTATATPDTRDEILRALGLPVEGTHVVLRGFARPNLALSVTEVEGPRDALTTTEAVLRVPSVLRATRRARASSTPARARTPSESPRPSRRRASPRSPITQASTARYGRRSRLRFAAGEARVIVATNAFGMGIDRSDVRVVVHAQPPASIEAYYQEVGRAGRDGAPAEGVLCIAPADIGLRRRLIETGTDGARADEQAIARAWRLFRDLLALVDARSCRHDSSFATSATRPSPSAAAVDATSARSERRSPTIPSGPRAICSSSARCSPPSLAPSVAAG